MQQILEYPKQILETKFSTILRNTERQQCFNRYTDGEKRCAMSAILGGHDVDVTYPYFMETRTYHKVVDVLHEHGVTVREITVMNDDLHLNFSQIADILDNKGL